MHTQLRARRSPEDARAWERRSGARSLRSWLGRRLFPSSLASPRPDSSLPPGRQEGHVSSSAQDAGSQRQSGLAPIPLSARHPQRRRGSPRALSGHLHHSAASLTWQTPSCSVESVSTLTSNVLSLVPSAQPWLTLFPVPPKVKQLSKSSPRGHPGLTELVRRRVFQVH